MRVDRLLRPLNTLDGRDVIELEYRECDEGDEEEWVDNDDNEMNDEWLWKSCDRLLRPLNTLDGRDVIELELRSYAECNDEWCVDNGYNGMNYE